MSLKKVVGLVAAAALLGLSATVHATACPDNGPCGPPTGNVILDLAGSTLPTSYTNYSVDFVASQASTSVSFAFRDDPGFWYLDDVSVASANGPNLLVNPGFELSGNGTEPTGWNVLNPLAIPPYTGAARSTTVGGGSCAHTGSMCYSDASDGAYDILTQAISTTIGDTYTVSFWLTQDGDAELATQVGDNATDVLVYVGDPPSYNVPEPGLLGLLGFGFAGLGALRRRRNS